jgi:hypothetical protein
MFLEFDPKPQLVARAMSLLMKSTSRYFDVALVVLSVDTVAWTLARAVDFPSMYPILDPTGRQNPVSHFARAAEPLKVNEVHG